MFSKPQGERAMYLSYQIQRMQAAATMTAVERRAADEEVGRLAADLSGLGQWIAGRARVLGLQLLAARRSVIIFRNSPAGIPCGVASTAAPASCALSRDVREI